MDNLMKRTGKQIIELSLLLILTLNSYGQYKTDKIKYDYRTYRYEPGDAYNPSSMGLASAVMPGIGQIYEGENLRGFCFLGSSITMFAIKRYFVRNRDYTLTFQDIIRQSNRIGQVLLRVWSGIDASRVAKVSNLASREKYKMTSQFKILPYSPDYDPILPLNNDPVGLTLLITF
jgi:hypothetical protein